MLDPNAVCCTSDRIPRAQRESEPCVQSLLLRGRAGRYDSRIEPWRHNTRLVRPGTGTTGSPAGTWRRLRVTLGGHPGAAAVTVGCALWSGHAAGGGGARSCCQKGVCALEPACWCCCRVAVEGAA